MKKYVKPELIYESFELSEQIASGCSENLLATYADPGDNKCKVDVVTYPEVTLFASGNVSCTVNEFEGYCYHNGGEGMTIFTS